MLYVKRLLDVNFVQSAMFFNLFYMTISCKSRIEKGISILKMINIYALFCVQSESSIIRKIRLYWNAFYIPVIISINLSWNAIGESNFMCCRNGRQTVLDWWKETVFLFNYVKINVPNMVTTLYLGCPPYGNLNIILSS